MLHWYIIELATAHQRTSYWKQLARSGFTVQKLTVITRLPNHTELYGSVKMWLKCLRKKDLLLAATCEKREATHKAHPEWTLLMFTLLWCVGMKHVWQWWKEPQTSQYHWHSSSHHRLITNLECLNISWPKPFTLNYKLILFWQASMRRKSHIVMLMQKCSLLSEVNVWQ